MIWPSLAAIDHLYFLTAHVPPMKGHFIPIEKCMLIFSEASPPSGRHMVRQAHHGLEKLVDRRADYRTPVPIGLLVALRVDVFDRGRSSGKIFEELLAMSANVIFLGGVGLGTTHLCPASSLSR